MLGALSNRCRHPAELAPHAALVIDLPCFGDPAIGDAEDDDLRHLYAPSGGRDIEHVAVLGAAVWHEGDDSVAFRDEIEQLEAPVGEGPTQYSAISRVLDGLQLALSAPTANWHVSAIRSSKRAKSRLFHASMNDRPIPLFASVSWRGAGMVVSCR